MTMVAMAIWSKNLVLEHIALKITNQSICMRIEREITFARETDIREEKGVDRL